MNPLSVLMVAFVFAFSTTVGWGGKGEGVTSGPHEGSSVIDDFSGDSIDPKKWSVTNDKPGPDVFSQSGGRLKFSATAGGGRLQSSQPVGPGFYSMTFHAFSSTNEEQPGSHRGAFVGLGLEAGGNFVRTIRCQNGRRSARWNEGSYIGVFEANYVDIEKGGIQVFYEETQATAGRLGLYYDGSEVTFYFNPDPSFDRGWQTMKQFGGKVLQWKPSWSEPPKLFIRGSDPSGSTRFQISDVECRPVPPEAP